MLLEDEQEQEQDDGGDHVNGGDQDICGEHEIGDQDNIDQNNLQPEIQSY